jgi:DNA-binding NtrC family response regulator
VSISKKQVVIMLDGLTVLVVEDDFLVAFEIADSVAMAGGIVLGPVPSVHEALALIETQPLDAAILDANLSDRNISPVLSILLARGVPFVLHTGAGVPDEMRAKKDLITVIKKPAAPGFVLTVLSRLLAEDARPHTAFHP